MMKCIGTSQEWDYCRVEKMGCEGCYYYKEEENKYEEEISERAES